VRWIRVCHWQCVCCMISCGHLHAARRAAVRIIPKFVGSVSSSAAARLRASWSSTRHYRLNDAVVTRQRSYTGIQRWQAGALALAIIPSRMPTSDIWDDLSPCLNVGKNTNVYTRMICNVLLLGLYSSEVWSAVFPVTLSFLNDHFFSISARLRHVSVACSHTVLCSHFGFT